jgi:hypothetical protein
MVEFEIKIPDELLALRNLPGRYIRARKAVLVPAMEKSIAAVERTVSPMVPVGATGEARRSIITSVRQTPASTVGKVTSTMRRPNIHVYVINAGRPAGKKQPPTDQLVPWVMAKGLASDARSARSLAFVIGRSIKKKGTKGLSFMWQGLDRAKGQVETIHSQAVTDITREMEKDA